MFHRVELTSTAVAIFWDGSQEKADALILRSAVINNEQFTFTGGVLEMDSTPVDAFSWLVFPKGLYGDTPILKVSDQEFKATYRTLSGGL